MNQYLLDTFRYNDRTNRGLLPLIAQLSEPSECIRLFSHLINCQYKWMARINQDPQAAEMSWWDPVYAVGDLEVQWGKSLQPWMDYLKARTPVEIATEVEYTGYDGGRWAATPQDIALQLNYHSIHHRGQLQMLIRNQGLEPNFVDYIGTKYRKLT